MQQISTSRAKHSKQIETLLSLLWETRKTSTAPLNDLLEIAVGFSNVDPEKKAVSKRIHEALAIFHQLYLLSFVLRHSYEIKLKSSNT